MKQEMHLKVKLLEEHVGKRVGVQIVRKKSAGEVDEKIWEGTGKIIDIGSTSIKLDVQVAPPSFWSKVVHVVSPWDGKNLNVPLTQVESRLDQLGQLTLFISQSIWDRPTKDLEKRPKTEDE